MKVITLDTGSPAHNLAADEALLNHFEETGDGEALRFWESPSYFVVLGYSNRLAREVREDICRERNIPILRRTSGGGTVLQGPGCLNYTLILNMDRDPALRNISSTTRYVLEKNCEALNGLVGGWPIGAGRAGDPVPPTGPSRRESPYGRQFVQRAGESDLIYNGRKFSGNAQRRLRRYVMFHGTFLLDFDLALIESVLQMPERQPEYRANRPHKDFIGNISVPKDTVKDALRNAWEARANGAFENRDMIERMVIDRYSDSKWTLKF